MPASSQASSELSTASLIVVRRAFEGLSKPRRWRFLTKNSETEISRCFVASDSAVTRWAALGSGVAGGGSSAESSAPASFGFPAAGGAFFAAALASAAGGAPSPKRSSWGRPALPFFVAALRLRHCLSLSPRPRQTRQSSIARGGDGGGPAPGEATLGQAGAHSRGQAAVAEERPC